MFTPLAAGKKVYAQGSFAPTRGTVDPTGYIQREIAKQQSVSSIGRYDGQSDTRSGLAAAALQRMKAVNTGVKPITNPRDPKLPHHPNTPPVVPPRTGGGHTPGTNPNPHPSQPGPHNPGGGTGGPANPAPPAPPPTIPVDNDGTLNLPYSEEYANAVLQAQQQYNSQMMDLQHSQQEQALAYQRAMRDTEQGYEDEKRFSLNNNAARGTAFSSQYGQAVGNDARLYNNATNDINSQNAWAQDGFNMGRTDIQNSLNSYLQQLALQYAQGLDDNAGGLGYGTNGPPVGTPAVPPAPGNGPHSPSGPSGPGGTRQPHHGGHTPPIFVHPKVPNTPKGPKKPNKPNHIVQQILARALASR